MKKLFFAAVAAIAISFASCDSKPAPTATPDDTPQTIELPTTAALDSVLTAGDSTGIKTFLTEIQDKIKDADPAKYAEQLKGIQEWLKANADKITAVVGTGAIADVVKQVTEFEIPSIGDAVGEAVDGAVEEGKEKVEGAVEDVKNAAEGVVEEGKAKVDGAVEDVKNAAEDVKGKVDEKVEDAKAVGDAVKNLVK